MLRLTYVLGAEVDLALKKDVLLCPENGPRTLEVIRARGLRVSGRESVRMRVAYGAVVVHTQVVVEGALVSCRSVARAKAACVLGDVCVSSTPIVVVVDALGVDHWELFVGPLLLKVECAWRK